MTLPFVQIPGYRLLHLLGEGGMGRVFLARDEALDRDVAVKLLSPDLSWEDEARARFLREGRVMAALEHPHVTRIYACGDVDGQPYFVMEYVRGENLAHRIWTERRLAIPDVLRITAECIQALQAAWAHGIVHRDVKPSNIMLDDQDSVRVTDFGLAKPTRWEDDITLPDAGVLMCTPYYVSPEQAQGEEEVDFRTDIYSLGIVLFEMLTGEQPFRAGSAMAVVVKAVTTPLPDLRSRRPDVPLELAALAEWMTRKRPDSRPQSYEELGQRLKTLADRGRSSAEAAATALATPAFLSTTEEPAAARVKPFVGRKRELAWLEGHLSQACEGRGGLVFATGEAGTGKTSLLAETVRQSMEAHPQLVAISTSSGVRGRVSDPYGPFREALALLTGDLESRWHAGRLSRDQASRLWRAFPSAGRALAETSPDLIGPLLDPDALRRRAEGAAPTGTGWLERLRGAVDRSLAHEEARGTLQPAIFEQYARFLITVATEWPLLLLIDDLHWTDPASLDLLAALAARLGEARVLIVGSYRESELLTHPREVRHPLAQVVNELESIHGHRRISLDLAGDREFCDELIDLEPNTLVEDFRHRLFERTGGHALFTVEFLGALKQRGMLQRDAEGRWGPAGDLDWNLLPDRVEAVIRERLGQLPSQAKEILSAASVGGEFFLADAVARIVGLAPGEMIRWLSEDLGSAGRLVELETIRRHGKNALPLYRFSHALFQVHLYEHLDEARKLTLHGAFGQAMEELLGEEAQEEASQLARHFRVAGQFDKAIAYSCQAGLRATAMSAFGEALAHFRQALAVLAGFPAGEQRDKQELEILMGLAAPLLSSSGWTHPEVGVFLGQAMSLARSLEDRSRQCDLLILGAAHDSTSTRYVPALAKAREGLSIASELGDEARTLAARGSVGTHLFYAGELSSAREELELALAPLDRLGHLPPAHGIAGIDSIAIALAWLGHTLRLLGYPDQADRRYGQAISRAEEFDLPHTNGLTRFHWQFSVTERGSWDLAEENLSVLEQLISGRGLGFFSCGAMYFRGWLLSSRGNPAEGAQLIQRSLELGKSIGLSGVSTVMLRDLATSLLGAGEIDAGLRTIDGAIASVEATGERMVEAELHRVRSDLLWARHHDGDRDQAEQSLERALEIARRQQARTWELRAAMALGRLWHERGRTHDALHLVQPVHDAFTEGFETRDLEQARGLLKRWTKGR